MKIIELITNTLAPFEIDVAFQQYTGSADKYVMFGIYSYDRQGYADDTYTQKRYDVQLSFWTKNPANLYLADDIEIAMERAGFVFDGGQDRYEAAQNIYGKNIDFVYVEYLENN